MGLKQREYKGRLRQTWRGYRPSGLLTPSSFDSDESMFIGNSVEGFLRASHPVLKAQAIKRQELHDLATNRFSLMDSAERQTNILSYLKAVVIHGVLLPFYFIKQPMVGSQSPGGSTSPLKILVARLPCLRKS